MSATRPTGVSILMPAYQLESSIADNIERVCEVVEGWPGCEIIVIDDGSTDDTRGYANKAAASNDDVWVVGYDVNRGKGGALKEGFLNSTGSTIVFLDADLDLPPEQLPHLLETFEDRKTDVLVGTKHTAMARGNYPPLRRLLSVAFAWINRLLFRLPVRETQTGLKIFRRQALSATLPMLQTHGYAFDLELLVRIRKAGGTMAEAPVELAPDSAGRTTLSTLLEMFVDTMRIWFSSLRWR